MSEQAEAWAGDFGNEYAKRSPGDAVANKHFFIRALAKTVNINTAIEFGCGVGRNLQALSTGNIKLAGVEINHAAAFEARIYGPIFVASMVDWKGKGQYDLAFTKGLLIHIPPPELPRAYDVLYQASRKYILIAEYFAPVLTEIEYRGRRDMLWKGPHAYDMLDRYPDLKLLDYGFVSKRDPYPQDDLNWWILEKRP